MTTLPEGSVIITPTEMYREMQAIAKNVDRVAAILDPSLAQIRSDLVEVEKANVQLASQVRALENWRWFVLGVAGVLGPLGGFLLTFLFGGSHG